MENVFCDLFNHDNLVTIAKWLDGFNPTAKLGQTSFYFGEKLKASWRGCEPLIIMLTHCDLEENVPGYRADVLITYIPFNQKDANYIEPVKYHAVITDDTMHFGERFKRTFEMLYKPLAEGKPEKYEALVENLHNLAALNNLE